MTRFRRVTITLVALGQLLLPFRPLHAEPPLVDRQELKKIREDDRKGVNLVQPPPIEKKQDMQSTVVNYDTMMQTMADKLDAISITPKTRFPEEKGKNNLFYVVRVGNELTIFEPTYDEKGVQKEDEFRMYSVADVWKVSKEMQAKIRAGLDPKNIGNPALDIYRVVESARADIAEDKSAAVVDVGIKTIGGRQNARKADVVQRSIDVVFAKDKTLEKFEEKLNRASTEASTALDSKNMEQMKAALEGIRVIVGNYGELTEQQRKKVREKYLDLVVDEVNLRTEVINANFTAAEKEQDRQKKLQYYNDNLQEITLRRDNLIEARERFPEYKKLIKELDVLEEEVDAQIKVLSTPVKETAEPTKKLDKTGELMGRLETVTKDVDYATETIETLSRRISELELIIKGYEYSPKEVKGKLKKGSFFEDLYTTTFDYMAELAAKLLNTNNSGEIAHVRDNLVPRMKELLGTFGKSYDEKTRKDFENTITELENAVTERTTGKVTQAEEKKVDERTKFLGETSGKIDALAKWGRESGREGFRDNLSAKRKEIKDLEDELKSKLKAGDAERVALLERVNTLRNEWVGREKYIKLEEAAIAKRGETREKAPPVSKREVRGGEETEGKRIYEKRVGETEVSKVEDKEAGTLRTNLDIFITGVTNAIRKGNLKEVPDFLAQTRKMLEEGRGKLTESEYKGFENRLVLAEASMPVQKQFIDIYKIEKMLSDYLTRGLINELDLYIIQSRLASQPKDGGYRLVSFFATKETVDLFVRDAKKESEANRYTLSKEQYEKMGTLGYDDLVSAVSTATKTGRTEATAIAKFMFEIRDDQLKPFVLRSFNIDPSLNVKETGEAHELKKTLGVPSKVYAPLDFVRKWEGMNPAKAAEEVTAVVAEANELKSFTAKGAAGVEFRFRAAEKEIAAIDDAVGKFVNGEKEALSYLVFRYVQATQRAWAGEHMTELMCYMMYRLQASGAIDFTVNGVFPPVLEGKKVRGLTSADDILARATTKQGRKDLIAVLQRWQNINIAEIDPKRVDSQLTQIFEHAKTFMGRKEGGYRVGGLFYKEMQKLVASGQTAMAKNINDGALGDATYAFLIVAVLGAEKPREITRRAPVEERAERRTKPEVGVIPFDVDIEELDFTLSGNDVEYRVEEVSWVDEAGRFHKGEPEEYLEFQAKKKGDVKVFYEWVSINRTQNDEILIDYVHPNSKIENPNKKQIAEMLEKTYYAVGDIETMKIYLAERPSYNPNIFHGAERRKIPIGNLILDKDGNVGVDIDSIKPEHKENIVFRTTENKLNLIGRRSTNLKQQGVVARIAYRPKETGD